MNDTLGKPTKEHTSSLGKILEFELPKSRFGFRHAFDVSQLVVSPQTKNFPHRSSLMGVTDNIRELYRKHEAGIISKNTALSLGYFLHLKFEVGHWIGICPDQHKYLVDKYLRTHRLYNFMTTNPQSEIFDFAASELDQEKVPYLRQETVGPRRVVFANSYNVPR